MTAQEFLSHSLKGLTQIEEKLSSLEKHPIHGDTLDDIIRIMTTIEEESHSLGFRKIEQLSGVGNAVFHQVRNEQLKVNTENAATLSKLLTTIRIVLEHIEFSNTEGKEEYDTLIVALSDLVNQAATEEDSNQQENSTTPPVEPIAHNDTQAKNDRTVSAKG